MGLSDSEITALARRVRGWEINSNSSYRDEGHLEAPLYRKRSTVKYWGKINGFFIQVFLMEGLGCTSSAGSSYGREDLGYHFDNIGESEPYRAFQIAESRWEIEERERKKNKKTSRRRET